MRAKFAMLIFLVLVVGCLGVQKKTHAPGDVNLRYMYITVWPDECNLTVTIEFKDNTPTFRDSRTTRMHEPISYSVNQNKVKRIHAIVSKHSWITQEKTWEGTVPFDVFFKLDMAR